MVQNKFNKSRHRYKNALRVPPVREALALRGGVMLIEKALGGAAHRAEEFVLAGIEISKNIENNHLVSPIMVCFSFSVELFLKGVLAEGEIDPGKKHDLWDLYNLLPVKKKNWVHRIYSDLVGYIEAVKFEEEMKRWGKSFIEIGYWHDESGKNSAFFDFSNFIPNLAISLNNAYLYIEKFPRFSFPQVQESYE